MKTKAELLQVINNVSKPGYVWSSPNLEDAAGIFKIYRSNPFYFSLFNETPAIENVLHDIEAAVPNKPLDVKPYFLLRKDKEPVAILDFMQDYPVEGTVYIGWLMVSGSYARKGVGRDAEAMFAEAMRSLGFQNIQLGIVVNNAPAFKFWEALGYRRISDIPKAVHDMDAEAIEYTKPI